MTASAADYRAAFDLARHIEADRVRVQLALAKSKSDALASLAERFDALATAVDAADGAPTPDAVSGYDQAAAMLGSP